MRQAIVPWGDMLQNLTRTLPAVGLTLAVGITYFAAVQLSLAVIIKSDGIALFWLAGGVSSGILIVLGTDARLPVAGGVAAATIIARLINDGNIAVATAVAFCNVSETLLAAWLIERHFGFPFSLDRLRNVLGLLAVASAATAASGVGASAAYKLFHAPPAPIWTTWQHWFGSGAVGMITVAPVVIGLAHAAFDAAFPSMTGTQRTVAGLFLAVVLAAGAATFAYSADQKPAKSPDQKPPTK
jgi:integral membrane sensor domain MASE1